MATQLVNTNIALATAGVTAQGFSDILFVSRHNYWSERVRTFTSVAGVLDAGVPSTHPIYIAAEGAFSQNPSPTQIKIGRFEATSVIKPDDVLLGKVYGLTLNAKDAADDLSVQYTAQAADTEEDIVTALKTAIDGEADIAAKVTTTIVGTGADAVLELSHTVAGDYFTVSALVNVSETFEATPEELAPEALAAIRAEDDDYYWLTSDVKQSAYVQALGSAQGAYFGVYAVSLAEADAYSNTLTGTFKVLLEETQPDTVYPMYSQDAETAFPEVAHIAEATFAQTGRITYHARQCGASPAKAIDGSNLTESQIANLKANKVNYFDKVKITGSSRAQRTNPSISVGGEVASGELLQVIVGRDSLAVDMEAANTNLLLQQKNGRIAYDRKGLNKIRSVMKNVLAQYADETQHDFIFPQNDSDFGFVITIPEPRDINPQDKLENILKQCTFSATLRGSIHYITITGALAN